MPIVKLFNGEEFAGDIIEDNGSALIIEVPSHLTKSKKVIPKGDIFSINY